MFTKEPFGGVVQMSGAHPGAFGRRLQKLRDARGYGVRQLAMLADVTPSTISGIENGNIRYPRRETREKLAKALRVTVDELEGRVAVDAEDIAQGVLALHDPEYDALWRDAPIEVKRDARRHLEWLLERERRRREGAEEK